MEQHVKLSKFLSYVLRHRPDSIGVTLDQAGWLAIDDLLANSRNGLTRDILFEIVRTDAKGRYAISDDGLRIRANQGHSIEVDAGFQPATPPPVLYHGTHQAALPAILKQGLRKMNRHHVHLSATPDKAVEAGRRRGQPVVLAINAQQMAHDGFPFFLSANGVWLVDHVPPQYLTTLPNSPPNPPK